MGSRRRNTDVMWQLDAPAADDHEELAEAIRELRKPRGQTGRHMTLLEESKLEEVVMLAARFVLNKEARPRDIQREAATRKKQDESGPEEAAIRHISERALHRSFFGSVKWAFEGLLLRLGLVTFDEV